MSNHPVTPHPRRRLLSAPRHTTRHDAPHQHSRRATQPHSQDPRRATPRATDRHTTRHHAPCPRSLSAVSVSRCIQTMGHAPLGRGSRPGKCAFWLWISSEEPVDNSQPPIGDFHTSRSYPQIVHTFSTGYQQVIHRKPTSYAMLGY